MVSLLRHTRNPLILAAFLATTAAARDPNMARWQAEAARVTITRDDWGIPHVRGRSDADAVFGMSYAQAEDDWNRVETNYLTALGRLAEAEGEKAVWSDLRQRLWNDEAKLQRLHRTSPAWLNGGVDIGAGLLLPYKRIFIIGLVIVTVILVYYFLFRTSAGRRLRAVMQNREMASCLGVRSRQVDAFTFAVGADLIHAVVPISAAHQRQIVSSEAKSVIDRSHTMRVELLNDSRNFRQLVSFFLVGLLR